VVRTTLLFIILCTNFVTAALVTLLCQYMTKNVVYDMESVRAQHYEDIQTYYSLGCRDGTDYPPEWREGGSGFNNNSPMMYCNKLREEHMEAFGSSTYALGKKRYCD